MAHSSLSALHTGPAAGWVSSSAGSPTSSPSSVVGQQGQCRRAVESGVRALEWVRGLRGR